MKVELKDLKGRINSSTLTSDFCRGVITEFNIEIDGFVIRENLRIVEEVEIPETITEFLQVKKTTEKDLVEWLLNNY